MPDPASDPRRPWLAVASMTCSVPALLVAQQAFRLYWFGPGNRAAGESVLELAIVSLWLMPLVLAALVLAGCARGYRWVCAALALAAPLLWALILYAEG